MSNNKYWGLLNMERGLGNTPIESLNNIYRVVKIKEEGLDNEVSNPIELIETMKRVKMDVPFFSGDERIFFAIYERVKELTNKELIEYASEILKKGKNGIGPFAPETLSNLLFSEMNVLYKDVLICDVEKYGVELFDFVKRYNSNFYFTIKNDEIRKVFELLYKDLNVSFINADIYDYEFVNKKFDYIVCFPIMGGRLLAEKERNDFISRDPSFIAVENLLLHLTMVGKLQIILPAKIGFGGGDAATLRDYLQSNYMINEISSLPTRVFYPYMAISTYFLSFSNGVTENINVKKYELRDQELVEADNRLVFADELADMNAWNVDMMFSFTDEVLLAYQNSIVKKAHLNEVAEVFRGKAVTDKADDGNVGVINISNITETGIDYYGITTINEEERKVARYLLQDGDVLIATKGFTIKVAVFEEQSRPCIASSNLCVIRPNTRLLNGTYLKLFLESETGMKLLKSLQRGTTIVNINYQDICQLEVPTPNLDEQCEMANEYNAGLKLYKETIGTAELAWQKIKSSIQKKLF